MNYIIISKQCLAFTERQTALIFAYIMQNQTCLL